MMQEQLPCKDADISRLSIPKNLIWAFALVAIHSYMKSVGLWKKTFERLSLLELICSFDRATSDN
jgi:hypothetical protein